MRNWCDKVNGFTLVKIVIVVSNMAELVAVARRRINPHNTSIDNDVLKLRDFIEKCVFECRTGSLLFFDRCTSKHKFKDLSNSWSEKEAEFFSHSVLCVKNLAQ